MNDFQNQQEEEEEEKGDKLSQDECNKPLDDLSEEDSTAKSLLDKKQESENDKTSELPDLLCLMFLEESQNEQL
jgi:hypothetical protein